MNDSINILYNASEKEKKNRNRLFELFRNTPVVPQEMLSNLSLYIKRQDLSEILFMAELYKQFINTHGVIMEFGVR